MKFIKQLNLILSIFFAFLVISSDIISINARAHFSKRSYHKRSRTKICEKIDPKSNFSTEDFVTAFLIGMTSTFSGEMSNLARSGVDWAAKYFFGKDSAISEKIVTINNFPNDCLNALVDNLDSHIKKSELEAQTFLDNQGKDKSDLYKKLGIDGESKKVLESLNDKPKELCKKLKDISSLKEPRRNFLLNRYHRYIELAKEAIDKNKDLKTLEEEGTNKFPFGLFLTESVEIKKALFIYVNKTINTRRKSGKSDSLKDALEEVISKTEERIKQIDSEYETFNSLTASNCSDLPETITEESKCVNAGFLTLVSSVWKTVKTEKFRNCMIAVVVDDHLSAYLTTPIETLLSMLGNLTSLLFTKFLESTYYAIRIITLLTKAKDLPTPQKSWNYGESAAYGIRLIMSIMTKRRKFFRKLK
jgi:hypothetical protein